MRITQRHLQVVFGKTTIETTNHVVRVTHKTLTSDVTFEYEYYKLDPKPVRGTFAVTMLSGVGWAFGVSAIVMVFLWHQFRDRATDGPFLGTWLGVVWLGDGLTLSVAE